MARSVITVNLDSEMKADLDVLAGLLGYSVTAYAARAIADQIERDKATFPKAYHSAKEVQETLREQKGA